jgi:hypothetical protein
MEDHPMVMPSAMPDGVDVPVERCDVSQESLSDCKGAPKRDAKYKGGGRTVTQPEEKNAVHLSGYPGKTRQDKMFFKWNKQWPKPGSHECEKEKAAAASQARRQ